MKPKLTVLAAVCVLPIATTLYGQTTVFSDSFTRADSTSLGSPTVGGAWTETASAGDIAVSVGEMRFTNSTSNNNLIYATSTFGAGWSSTLTNNTDLVTWSFNIRQSTADPAGFDNARFGAAFVLGATGSDFTVASGYAVVIGNTGTTDPIRLVRFTNGLDADANLTNIISAGAPLTDVGSSYLSIKVTFDPSTDTWSFFGRNDDPSPFEDPLGGSLTSLGSSVIDSTYTTGANPLTNIGTLWNFGNDDNQSAEFDNIVVSVPEPEVYAAIVGLATLAFVIIRRRFTHADASLAA